ncbi:unnamed protein product [Hydatigera taeniaeformis]|uniref:Secreted protein n=1 Tax=Hydatigena taeniaeformis TaxID=6205 RepID=A0A0R3X974_HYDTA|nr:unnamed protein product [Hydatigera taeniaeformis]
MQRINDTLLIISPLWLAYQHEYVTSTTPPVCRGTATAYTTPSTNTELFSSGPQFLRQMMAHLITQQVDMNWIGLVCNLLLATLQHPLPSATKHLTIHAVTQSTHHLLTVTATTTLSFTRSAKRLRQTQ